jgi:hypothetical protein
VVLHEGVALIPRNLVQSARRSVLSVCPRSGRPARSAGLIKFRVFIVGTTNCPGKDFFGNQTIQLLLLSSPDGAIYEVEARAALVLWRGT